MRKTLTIIAVIIISVLIHLNQKQKYLECNKKGSLAEKINFGGDNCDN